MLPINPLSSPISLFLFHFPNRNVLDITASHPFPLQQHVHIYKLMWFSLQSWVFRLSRWLNEIQNKWLGQDLTKWWCWHCNLCLLTPCMMLFLLQNSTSSFSAGRGMAVHRDKKRRQEWWYIKGRLYTKNIKKWNSSSDNLVNLTPQKPFCYKIFPKGRLNTF